MWSWDGSKFESLLPRILFWHVINISSRNLRKTQLIEFWAISGSHACSNLWQISFDDSFDESFANTQLLLFAILKNYNDDEKNKILDDEMFKDGDDDLSDLTSSEQSQLNDWYDNLSSKYDKVGNIIREVSQWWLKVFMTRIYDSYLWLINF